MSLADLKEYGYTADDILAAKASTFSFTTTFFKNPNDPNVRMQDLAVGEAWAPYKPQIRLYNLIDFGYDIAYNKFKPEIPAEIVVMVWPRQYGKTEACSSAAASLAIRYPNSNIGIISAGDAAAKDFIKRIIKFIEYSPFSNMIQRERVDRIELTNGSVIMSLPTSEKAIRGKSFRWVFVDEAAIIDDEAVDAWIMPTVRTAGAFRQWKTPSIILLSTPHGAKGRFYDYYVSGLEKREIGCRSCELRRPVNSPEFLKIQFHPRVMAKIPPCPKCGGNDFEYIPNGIITVTLDPWNHPTRTTEELQAELDIRGNTAIAKQELLGEIIQDESGVFMREWLENCIDMNLLNVVSPSKDHRYVMGVDFGKIHDATVMSIGHMEDSTVIMDYMFYMSTQGGIEYNEIRYKVLSLVDIFRPSHLALDATGMGNPIVEQIDYDIRDLQTIGIAGRFKQNGGMVEYHIKKNPYVYTKILNNKTNQLGFIFDYNSKADLIDNLSNLFQRRLIRIPNEYTHDHIRILWKELINFGYDYSPSNRIIYGTQRDHDDTVIAVALMAWGLREIPWYHVSAELMGEDEFVL